MYKKSIEILIGACLSFTAQAVDYIKIAPMDQVVNGTVSDVRKTDVTTIPIITWGGDVATLYGNGDSVITTADSDLGKLGLKNRLI